MARCDACGFERGARRGVVPASGFGRAMLCGVCYEAATGVRQEVEEAAEVASAKFRGALAGSGCVQGTFVHVFEREDQDL